MRDTPADIVWQIAIANVLLFLIFVDAYPLQEFGEYGQWLAFLVGFWPFWMFVGGLAVYDMKPAWLNHRQTWMKVAFGYCFSLSAAIVFLIVVQRSH